MEISSLDKPTINIFEILNLRKERYHNAMLAWLLDPNQSHGLDDAFLSRFLKRVEVENYIRDDFQDIQPEYTLSATDDSTTRRPDIFIETGNYKIYIENKVSRGSINDQQLKDQALYISEDAGGKEDIHVFIVPRQGDIQSSTQNVVKEHNICTVDWSELVQLLEALLVGNEVADPHVRAVLEQYLDYVKEHIVHMFKGFDVKEMQKYVEAAEVIWRFEKGESPTKQQIKGFLTIVAEGVLSQLSGAVSGGWDFQIKQRRWAAVWWGIYFTSEHYPNIDFYIEIYYAPQFGSSDGLSAMVGANLYGEHIPQLKEVIHAESSKFVGQDTENYAASDRYRCAEHFDEVQWSSLEQWRSFRDCLVGRTFVWMTELIPVIEKTLQPLRKRQRAKK